VGFLTSALLLGGPLGLLPPVDHRAALAMLALPDFSCWWASPHYADVLGRCQLTGPAVVPPVCLLSSPIARTIAETFRSRFGVPLRQTYSSSETGPVTVDAAAAAEVNVETVGRPLSGVEVRIGESPDAPQAAGDIGRIWVRSRWQMIGYGIPPQLDRADEVDGWWPTRDLGSIESDGRLSLHGRLDGSIRTRDGRVVHLGAIERLLTRFDGVRAAVVLPLDGESGATFSAIVEAAVESDAALRKRITDELPPWARPRILTVVGELPRLPNGKLNRRACALLDDGPRR
jgi:acyl-coenzyme A synthetase/AMP-(fatty) acid ligase